jgi:signal transduction histidine kinase
MIKRIINKIRFSIFFKLILILALAGFLINIVVSNVMRSQMGLSHQDKMKTHLLTYIGYIISDLGDPPTKKKAEKIAHRLTIMIKYDSKDLTWQTHSPFPKKVHHRWRRNKDKFLSWGKGHLIKEIKTKKGAFTIAIKINNTIQFREELMVLMILLLSLIIIGVYWMIRRVLKPICYLKDGTEEMGKGNFKYRIPVVRKDELGELSESFNAMSEKIEKTIESKEQLLLDVSHELRSPLTRVKVALEFIEKSDITKSINEDVSEIESMISEILESERLKNRYGVISYKDLDLVVLLHDVVSESNRMLPGVVLECDLKSAVISGENDRLKIAVKNLIENSCKYSADSMKKVIVSLHQKDDNYIIKVKDHGVGIPEDHVPYLFEPFYRVDPSRSKETGGYGLGLHMVKKIIEAHNGSIEIESAVNQGTTVIITLPIGIVKK